MGGFGSTSPINRSGMTAAFFPVPRASAYSMRLGGDRLGFSQVAIVRRRSVDGIVLRTYLLVTMEIASMYIVANGVVVRRGSQSR